MKTINDRIDSILSSRMPRSNTKLLALLDDIEGIARSRNPRTMDALMHALVILRKFGALQTVVGVLECHQPRKRVLPALVKVMENKKVYDIALGLLHLFAEGNSVQRETLNLLAQHLRSKKKWERQAAAEAIEVLDVEGEIEQLQSNSTKSNSTNKKVSRRTKPPKLESVAGIGIVDEDVYIATDSLVAKIDKKGNATLVAGHISQGIKDGVGKEARFRYIAGMVVDEKRNIYVADAGAKKIRCVDANGKVTNFRFAVKTKGEGTSTRPISAITLGPKGALYFADMVEHGRVLWRIADGEAHLVTHEKLGEIADIAVDNKGNIIAISFTENRVYRVSRRGKVTIVAGNGKEGFKNGVGKASRFDAPQGVAVDDKGNIFVADLGNDRVRKVDPQGRVSTIKGKFDCPLALTIANGKLYVAGRSSSHVYVHVLDKKGKRTTLLSSS